MNKFGFKKLEESLKQNVRHLGVEIRLMYLIFKQDMIFPNVREEILISQIYNLFALDVIYQWEANTLSKSGVKKVNNHQNGIGL